MESKHKAMKKILYYGLKNIQQEKQLNSILSNLGIAGIKVEERDLQRSVGELAGILSPSENADDCENVPGESVIVMHDVDDLNIQKLLDEVKAVPGLNIELKAVITDNNINWPFCELIAELRQEHRFMQIYMSTYKVTQQAEQWISQNKQSLESLKRNDPNRIIIQRLTENIYKSRKLILEVQNQNEIDIQQLADIGQKISTILKSV